MVRMLRMAALLVVPALLLVPAVQADDEKKAEEPKPAGLDWAAVFKKLDTNGDGKLTADEFQKLADLPEVKVLVDGRRVTDPQLWQGTTRLVIGG